MNSAVATTQGNHLFTVEAVVSGIVVPEASGIGLDGSGRTVCSGLIHSRDEFLRHPM